MSGHSKWSTIKRKKGKADAARGRLFSRLIREITVAAKMGGGDIEANTRLRTAVSTAKANNMPAKNIENAIAKGTGDIEGVNYEEATFEAYGPGGVAFVIDTLTDNRNRTVSDIRHNVNKMGGKLGEANSVQWMFNSKGIIQVQAEGVNEEELMEIVLDAGAEDMEKEDDVFTVTTPVDTFTDVTSALENAGIKTDSAQLTKVPENTVPVEGDNAAKVLSMLSALDDLDDTQNVYCNFDISDEDMEKYSS